VKDTMTTASPTAAPSRRMSLEGVTRGARERPKRVLAYGPEGVGKSSFGAAAPAPIFLGAEDGTASLDVARFAQPQSWQDILDAVDTLTTAEHPYDTLVVDSLDWAEPLAWARVCADGGKKSIEDFGYGKGYVAAVDLWRGLLARLDILRDRRGMHVVLVAHAAVRRFQNPEGEDFDRYSIKLHEKSAGPIKEWCDAVLFATWETLTRETDNGKNKGVHTGKRVIYTERHAAWDAKNRYGLPPVMPLEWAAFEEGVRLALGVGDELERLLARVDEETRAKAKAWLGARHRLPHELAEMVGKLRAKVPATPAKGGAK
jgi:hypothetical protein